MRQVESEQPTPPSELADVPAGLDDVLLTAVATERDERYDAIALQELFGRSCVRELPVERHVEVGNAVEIPVAGDKRRGVLPGGGGDECVTRP